VGAIKEDLVDLTAARGETAEDFAALGKEAGYAVDIHWSGPGTEGMFDAVFMPLAEEGGVIVEGLYADVAVPAGGEAASDASLSAYANAPLRAKLERLLVPSLRNFLKSKLPEHMVPGAFVLMSALPLSPNGKVDRRALPRPLLLESVEEEFVAPRNRTEEILVKIWSEVLGLERVGIHGNFFELGGDSISSVQVANRAGQAGIPLTLRHMFLHQTIAELAEAISSEPNVTAGALAEVPSTTGIGETPSFYDFPLARLNRPDLERLMGDVSRVEDAYPLTGLQENGLLYRLNNASNGLYLVEEVYNLHGDMDVHSFVRALQTMTDRYPTMRTSFLWEGVERPLQVVHRGVEALVDYEDWRRLSAAEQKERLSEYREKCWVSGFDPVRAPQSRLGLFRVASDIHWYCNSFNYMLRDGWSYPIIFKELFSLYEAYREGKDLELPQHRPYRDYIASLQERDAAPTEAYWRKALAGACMPTPFPAQGPCARLADQRTGYAIHPLSLSRTTRSALALLARGAHLTLNTLMQGAWALILSRYSGRQDVVFGVVVTGRPANLGGVELMVGQLNNIVPIRVQVNSETPLLPWLADLQAHVAEMRDHEHIPIRQLNEWLGMEHDALPFFSYLVYENFPREPHLPGTIPLSTIMTRQGLASQQDRIATLRMDARVSAIRTEHPLRIGIWPRETLDMHLCYYRCYLDPALINGIADSFRSVLEGFMAGTEQRLSRLLNLVVPPAPATGR
jgi:hypothetical protein